VPCRGEELLKTSFLFGNQPDISSFEAANLLNVESGERQSHKFTKINRNNLNHRGHGGHGENLFFKALCATPCPRWLFFFPKLWSIVPTLQLSWMWSLSGGFVDWCSLK